MINKRVQKAYLFENGNIAALDIAGQQIPELQGAYSIETHKRILLEAVDDCEFLGFYSLPPGFNITAKQYADYFKKQNLSWEEIQAL